MVQKQYGFLLNKGLEVVGIDNDMRAQFFGKDASTHGNLLRLKQEVANFRHLHNDIRNPDSMLSVFKHYRTAIAGVIHTAAQPSHD